MHEIQKINELTRWDGEVSPPQSLRIRNVICGRIHPDISNSPQNYVDDAEATCPKSGLSQRSLPPIRMEAIPHGPISLPKNATFVSDVDEEIFLLYTRLAALKPPDSSDTGHFHGLGTENSKEDALLVRIELKPPRTACELTPNSEKSNRNAGRRKRGKKREGSNSRSEISVGRGKEPEPVVLEYTLFQDITALRSRTGDTGSVLWKTRLCPPVQPVLKPVSHPYLASSFCRWY